MKKLSKGDSRQRFWYLKKDIQHLAYDPLLKNFRSAQTFTKKLRKMKTKREWSALKQLRESGVPLYSLDRVILERYPTFTDALADLDDALCLLAIFAALPSNSPAATDDPEQPAVVDRRCLIEPMEGNDNELLRGREREVSVVCSELLAAFQRFVVHTRSLRRTFVSVKGIYYQALINDTPITWCVPHKFTQVVPPQVDMEIMQTFLEFYVCLVGFVNFRLYSQFSLQYPPTAASSEEERLVLKCIDNIEVPVEVPEERNFFAEWVFFLGRETPVGALEFLIEAHGGRCVRDAADSAVTHQVIDRSLPDSIQLGRIFVQPQFVFDCVNAGKGLDAAAYAPGAKLPPHLSPFVEDEATEQPNDENSTEADKERREMAISMLSSSKRKQLESLAAASRK